MSRKQLFFRKLPFLFCRSRYFRIPFFLYRVGCSKMVNIRSQKSAFFKRPARTSGQAGLYIMTEVKRTFSDRMS